MKREKTHARGNGAFNVLSFVYKKLLSPLLHNAGGWAGACRFQPSCSEYAALAIAHHGIFRGGLLALRRISKCHPFHPAGFDPVPGTWPVETAPPVQGCDPPIIMKRVELCAHPATAWPLPVAHTASRSSIGRPFARD